MSDIRNISDAEILRAFANYPLDDSVREQAIFELAREAVQEAYAEMQPSPLELITTDYEWMLEMGDYGGVEG